MSARGSERPADPPRHASAGRSPSAEVEGGRFSAEELAVLLRVGELVRRLEFGSVLVVVQDGKVVQIEMAEKIRLR